MIPTTGLSPKIELSACPEKRSFLVWAIVSPHHFAGITGTAARPTRQGEARRVAGRGWAQTAPRVVGTRLARGRGPVGAGWGPGGAGERASMGAMRRRGQHEGGRKSPIDSSSRPQWAARRMAACVGAMRAAKRDAYKTAAMNAGGGHKRDGRGRACGKQARPAPQGAKPVRPDRMPLPQGARPVPPDRMPLPRKGRAALATSSRHA